MDDHGDWITNRGFRQTEPIPGLYGGTVRVYESSLATQPALWVAVDDTPEGTIHLTVEDARRLAENILRVCDLHYQL